MPPKLLQANLYKNKNLDEIISLTKNKQKLSPSTIRKYLIKISEFFKYCPHSEYIDKNPAIDIQISIGSKDTTNKKPYTDEEANKIFNTVSQIKQNGNTKSKRINSNDLYFITFIAALSGMIAKEITQLTANDIILRDDIYCFSINTDGDKSVKTKKQYKISSYAQQIN